MELRELTLKWIGERMRRSPIHVNRMSSIGHPCMRRLVLDRMFWEDIPAPSPELAAIFESGNVTEAAIIRHLQDIGCKITHQQTPVRWGTLVGHPEGLVQCDALGWCDELFEVKTLAPHVVSRIESVEQLATLSPYYCTYAAQGQAYMAAMEKKHCLWIVCPRGNHLAYRTFWQTFDPDFAGALKHKSAEIDERVAAGQPPEAAWLDEICEACYWRDRCFPAREREAAEFAEINDPELAELLARWSELKPAAKEFEELDEARKKKLEGVVGRCGKWIITGKWIESTWYDVPKEIKERYAAKRRYWKGTLREVE